MQLAAVMSYVQYLEEAAIEMWRSSKAYTEYNGDT